MKKLLFIIICVLIVACSSEEKQMEALKNRAIDDVTRVLKLPDGTKFNEDTLEITEKASDIDGIGTTFVVKVKITAQGTDGHTNSKNHILEYVKVRDEGLSPTDYELLSFN